VDGERTAAKMTDWKRLFLLVEIGSGLLSGASLTQPGWENKLEIPVVDTTAEI
jgi:hypothetical protein